MRIFNLIRDIFKQNMELFNIELRFPYLFQLFRVPLFRGCTVSLIVFFGIGCSEETNYVDKVPEKPFAGKDLKIAISGKIKPDLLKDFLPIWTTKSGANLILLDFGEKERADLLIFQPEELSSLVYENWLEPLPNKLISLTNEYQYSDIPTTIGDRLGHWDTSKYAVPILGPGKILIYRPDLDLEYKGVNKDRKYTLQTWEDFIQFAEYFHEKTQKPTLPALLSKSVKNTAGNTGESNDSLNMELIHLFDQIALCYDQQALQLSNLDRKGLTPAQKERFFSFHFQLSTGEPRITNPSFEYALMLLQRMQKCRSQDSTKSAVDSFLQGETIWFLADLDDLYKLSQQKGTPKIPWEIGPIPGSRFTFEPAVQSSKLPFQMVKLPEGVINRIPYIGWGGWFAGFNRKSQAIPEAIDFINTFANPQSFSLEWIRAGKWGAGPFRNSHFDSRNRNNWYGYNLTPSDTDRLVDILRDNLGFKTINYGMPLRIPDRMTYLKPLDQELKKVLLLGVDRKNALKTVAEIWKKTPLSSAIYRLGMGI